jgi:hypothetical protein
MYPIGFLTSRQTHLIEVLKRSRRQSRTDLSRCCLPSLLSISILHCSGSTPLNGGSLQGEGQLSPAEEGSPSLGSLFRRLEPLLGRPSSLAVSGHQSPRPCHPLSWGVEWEEPPSLHRLLFKSLLSPPEFGNPG